MNCLVLCYFIVKDIQQERTAVLPRSQINALCFLGPYPMLFDYIYLNSQFNTLSIDIKTLEIILRSILWQCWELKKSFFYQHFLNMDISLHR